MLLSFEPRDNPVGLEITDRIERRQCRLNTSTSVSPHDAPLDEFYFPVDRGVSITTDRVSLPHTVATYVRNHAGWMIAELNEGDSREFPEDRYSVELTTPIKLYMVFEAPSTIEVTAEDVTLSFDRPAEILVGARSHHKHPAATVTVTEDPEDMMAAISCFGSALKTTTCERSYPTLRGHPPMIELGDDLHVPSVLDPPDTGIRLEIPPDYRSVFTASTLAYYLGAEVVPGQSPKIVTDSGFTHRLDGTERGFEGEIERVLKQVFFLDCVTRTEGYYPVDLHERNQIEPAVDLDFARLYDQPLETQLERYLDVPYSTVEPHVPKWKLTARVVPEAEHAEMLPFVVEDLAVIRSATKQPTEESTIREAAGGAFARDGGFTRGAGSESHAGVDRRSETDSVSTPELIELDETDSVEQTWIGEGMPLGASKGMIEAFRNRLDREPTDGDIDITVVCNDMAMQDERDVVDEVYGSREEVPFDVTVHRGLTTQEIREVLQDDVELFHYIGHIDVDGFKCIDGRFDSSELNNTNVDVFFLNACTSYQQGVNLINAGSIGGVVTLQDIINSGAEKVGKTFAKLLNWGFPLRAALNIASQQSIMGKNYLVLGDGGLDIAQPESGTALIFNIRPTEQNYLLSIETYPTKDKGLGSLFLPYVNGNARQYLVSGNTGDYKLTKNELDEYMMMGDSPVIFDSGFIGSNDVSEYLS